MRASGHVGERLVDRDALDVRCEVAQDADGRVAEALVFVKVSADKHEVRTELPRPSSRHTAVDAEGARFIRSGEHDSAADGDRLASQPRIEQLFDRRVEGVEISMKNGG